MQRRALHDAQTPDKLKRNRSLMGNSQLSVEEKKRKILRNLRRLESLGVVDSANQYQEIVNELAKVLGWGGELRVLPPQKAAGWMGPCGSWIKILAWKLRPLCHSQNPLHNSGPGTFSPDCRGSCPSAKTLTDSSLLQDIRNQRRYRQHRRGELDKLRQTLEALHAKSTFYEEQVDYYNQYIRTCLGNLATSSKYACPGAVWPSQSGSGSRDGLAGQGKVWDLMLHSRQESGRGFLSPPQTSLHCSLHLSLFCLSIVATITTRPS